MGLLACFHGYKAGQIAICTQHECTECRAMSMGPQNSGFLSAVSASISLTRTGGLTIKKADTARTEVGRCATTLHYDSNYIASYWLWRERTNNGRSTRAVRRCV